ncbi:hypothetical protein B0H14DRAFT_2568478 [Mycena olivaceomarginata]|nr:hypothetical protein B0H14DRAFT_2568478 [Mycena olivaceomarginata]
MYRRRSEQLSHPPPSSQPPHGSRQTQNRHVMVGSTVDALPPLLPFYSASLELSAVPWPPSTSLTRRRTANLSIQVLNLRRGNSRRVPSWMSNPSRDFQLIVESPMSEFYIFIRLPSDTTSGRYLFGKMFNSPPFVLITCRPRSQVTKLRSLAVAQIFANNEIH